MELGQLAECRFGDDDQRWFADASGDRNPLHMDELVARRSMFGQPVVHGMHALLWALDVFIAERQTSVSRITVSFRRPIFIDEAVRVVVVQEDDHVAEVQLRHDESTLTTARFVLGDVTPAELDSPHDEITAVADSMGPLDLGSDTIGSAAGHISNLPAQGLVAKRFASAASVLGGEALGHIAALSRLVGMECPGLHSLFTGFDVELGRWEASDGVNWHVMRYDDRVSSVRMQVSSRQLQGHVDAFVRPRPVAQPRSSDLRGTVDPAAFEGMRALIVGGSRGLGEVTAKLVAAGGGSAVVTWHRGAADAQAVVDDIRAAGGAAEAIQLDVGEPESAVAAIKSGGLPTHLFYFATPRIFARRTQLFDDELFQGFCAVYVTGFIKVLDALREHGLESLAVFYPSSVAVDEQLTELTEYAAAKAASEVVARTLGDGQAGWRVHIERLPRLRTDQTATLLTVPAASSEQLMLEQLEVMVNL